MEKGRFISTFFASIPGGRNEKSLGENRVFIPTNPTILNQTPDLVPWEENEE